MPGSRFDGSQFNGSPFQGTAHDVFEDAAFPAGRSGLPFRCVEPRRFESYMRNELPKFETASTKFHLLTCGECRNLRDSKGHAAIHSMLAPTFQPAGAALDTAEIPRPGLEQPQLIRDDLFQADKQAGTGRWRGLLVDSAADHILKKFDRAESDGCAVKEFHYIAGERVPTVGVYAELEGPIEELLSLRNSLRQLGAAPRQPTHRLERVLAFGFEALAEVSKVGLSDMAFAVDNGPNLDPLRIAPAKFIEQTSRYNYLRMETVLEDLPGWTTPVQFIRGLIVSPTKDAGREAAAVLMYLFKESAIKFFIANLGETELPSYFPAAT